MDWTYDQKLKHMGHAQYISTWSKDPSSKIGAVAVVGSGLPIIGYNGFPRGMKDTEERLNDRAQKYPRTVHAEMNCIYNAAELGVSLRNSSMFVYGLPVCGPCSLGVIQAGIKKVYIQPGSTETINKWIESFQQTADNFEECGVHWEVLNAFGDFIPNYRFR